MSQVFQELDRLSDLLKVHKVPAAEWQKTLHCGASSFVGRRYSSQANCTAVWRPDLFDPSRVFPTWLCVQQLFCWLLGPRIV